MMNTSPNNNKVGCVIMASGLGLRFGGNKLMATFGDKPMVSWILDSATKCFDEVVVVTRNKGVLELCNSKGIKVVFHDFPYRSDTIRIGIENLSNDVCGVTFCLADQPFLSALSLRKFITSVKQQPDCIWRSCCKDTIGSPNYFPKKLFEELTNLPQDLGGSYVCKKHPDIIRMFEIDNPLELTDIDTKEIYDDLLPVSNYLSIWNAFLESGKKHLFITGDRGSGKTTMVGRILKLLGTKDIPTITSVANKGVDVRLTNNITNEEVVVGKYNESSSSVENRMLPVVDAFDTKGYEFVNLLMKSQSEWVVIDEIGYLESTSRIYQDAIFDLLKCKRVVAVVRKQNEEFLLSLVNYGDSYLVEL